MLWTRVMWTIQMFTIFSFFSLSLDQFFTSTSFILFGWKNKAKQQHTANGKNNNIKINIQFFFVSWIFEKKINSFHTNTRHSQKKTNAQVSFELILPYLLPLFWFVWLKKYSQLVRWLPVKILLTTLRYNNSYKNYFSNNKKKLN